MNIILMNIMNDEDSILTDDNDEF